MSYRLLAGIAAALMVSAAAHAQTSDRQTTRYQTPEGELTVHSGQPGPRTYAPPPPFAQLAGGKGYITSADAEQYDLLANDFIHADANRDGRITRREYDSWVHSQ